MSIIDASAGELPDSWTADVCIVGAGAAGLTLADALAADDFTVCVIESGGFVFDEQIQALYDLISVGHPQRSSFMSRVRCFGGSCNLWGGRSIELQPLDFEHRSWIPWSGWPIAPHEVTRYYRQARALLNLPGPEASTGRHLLSDAERAFLADGDLAPTYVFYPRTPRRFGRSYRERLARSDRVQVLVHANVVSIDLDPFGQEVRSLTVKTLSGRSLQVHARAFTLACGGLETPRLMLVSRDRHASGVGNGNDLVGRFFMDHPRAAFGRVHLTSAGAGRLVERQRVRGGRLKLGLHADPAVQRREGLLNHYLTLENKFSLCAEKNYPRLIELAKLLLRGGGRGHYQVGKAHAKDLIYLLAPEEVLPEAAQRWLRPLRSWGSSAATERGHVVVYDCEQPPDPESRVSLSHEMDRLGLNRLILDWRIDSRVYESVDRLQTLLARTLELQGIGRLAPEEGLPHYSDASHHMGTTRMSASPRTGVVTPDCQVHGVPNLFVASSSVFPTTGHANPTLTIIALTLRLADHLGVRLRRPQPTVGIQRVA